MLVILVLLVIIIFVSVLNILSEILSKSKCPDASTLKRVVLGRARNSPGLVSSVQKHLGRCEKCRSKIDGIVNGAKNEMEI